LNRTQREAARRRMSDWKKILVAVTSRGLKQHVRCEFSVGQNQITELCCE